jgi:predicted nuclease of predicted toxin-antitoxin system
VKGILADANITGYMDLLVARMQGEPWKLFWNHLRLRYVHFSDVGLAVDAPDELIWQTCQNNDLYLITDNRNEAGSNSLEATIRAHNTPTSLPVFTIADVQRIRHSREYADQVIETLLEYLMQEDNILGTSRLYLP